MVFCKGLSMVGSTNEKTNYFSIRSQVIKIYKVFHGNEHRDNLE